MKIVYRYVLTNFLRYLFLALLILVFIYVIINLFDNLGKYMSKNIPFHDIIIFYLYQVPSYIILLIPVAAIIGAFFIFGYMTKHREFIALKSGGFDINRFFFLILGTGAAIAVLTFVFQETAGIWAKERLFEHQSEKIDKRPVKVQEHRRNFFYYGENNWVYFIRDYNGKDTTMKNVTLWGITDQQRINRRIDAVRGKYEEGWVFESVTVRDFDTLGNEMLQVMPRLKLSGLVEKPGDFLRRTKPIEEMNFLDIYRFVRKRSRAGEDVAKERVELNYRFSFPLITVILLVICLPLALVLRRGGVAIGLGISIVLAFVYWGLIQSCRAYGYAGEMEPVLAAWLPNIIFAIIAAVMVLEIRR